MIIMDAPYVHLPVHPALVSQSVNPARATDWDPNVNVHLIHMMTMYQFNVRIVYHIVYPVHPVVVYNVIPIE